MDPVQLSEYLSTFITLLFLGVGALFDLKSREVPDKVWLLFGPIGLALTVFRTYIERSLFPLTAVSIGASILIAFGLVFFGLAGGADAKAMICLGLTLPLPPTIATTILGFVHPFYPIVILLTGYVCSFSVAIWILGRNALSIARGESSMFRGLENESMWKKALALFTGSPTSIARLKSTYYLYPMEEIVEDNKGTHRSLQLYSKVDVNRDQAVSEFLQSLRKVGSPEIVWVTPGLPLLVFIFFSVIITLVLGDPIFSGMFLLLRR